MSRSNEYKMRHIRDKLSSGQPLSLLEAEIVAALVTQRHMIPSFVKDVEEAKYYAS